MIQIRKRDNTLVDFDKEKIINAIIGAFLEVDGVLYEDDTAQDIADDIEQDILNTQPQQIIGVETIQDWVEDYLMRSERKDVAKAYIRFRYKKEVAREYKSDFIDAIAEKLEARNVQNQNANVDEHSFGGRMGEANDVLTKKYALDYQISDMAKYNHENNIIYIHDLSAYAVGMHNCLSIPFDDLLAKGFNTRQTDVRPAGSINTAFQLVAVIFQLESLQQFGGVSATHLDWTMVPYVRKSFAKHYIDGLQYISRKEWPKDFDYEIEAMLKDPTAYSIEDSEWEAYDYEAYKYAMDMTVREAHQAVEGMYHNLKIWA